MIGRGFCRRRHAIIIISADTTPSLALTRGLEKDDGRIRVSYDNHVAAPFRLRYPHAACRRREWCVGANAHEVWASGKHNCVVGEHI